MIEIGRFHNLPVIKTVDFGVYLDAGDDIEILLPRKQVPEAGNIGDKIDVFIYHDSEERLVATTQKPLAVVGQIALLPVKSVSKVGAFLDWNLPRDLFVPFREQQQKMVAGQSYAVYVYIDEISNRITASSRIDRFLTQSTHEFEEGQAVELIVYDSTPLGYKAIIDNRWIGVLYSSEIFRELETGLRIRGFIKKVREDNKIDLSLHGPGYRKVDDIASDILEQLKKFRDNIEISDKSSPELIYQLFGVSKKTFKRAIGLLYKQHLITIDDDGVHVI